VVHPLFVSFSRKTMAKHLLVIQHTSWEKPGKHLIQAARARKVRLDVWQAWHESLPDIGPYNGLIVLGGTPNVDEEDRYSFLKHEKKLIQQAVKEDMPYLGFCLGHQLLAEALGARVGPNFTTSVGFISGQVTKDGRHHPLFRDIPSSVPLFKWHTQTVLPPLPKEMEILVTSMDCEIEAISIQGRPHLVGLQFDNYAASLRDVREWVNSDLGWLLKAGADAMKLIRDAEEQETLIGAQFDILFDNFISLIT
jgi:GMP synthase (glutamine-hydrolysing)